MSGYDIKRNTSLNLMGSRLGIVEGPPQSQNSENQTVEAIRGISLDGLNCDYARVDILDENIDEINLIISKVLNKEKLEGQQYTNGNLNKIV